MADGIAFAAVFTPLVEVPVMITFVTLAAFAAFSGPTNCR